MGIHQKLSIAAMIGAIAMGTSAQETTPKLQAGGRLQRTMRLLATSTAERRNPVKILFYGQSIVRQDYARKAIERDLRKRYPHADLTVENRAIGGYTAPALIYTANQDLYPTYPDLMVFHVYGGERGGQFEGILRNTRQNTTAEILTWTHHPDARGIDNPGHESASQHRREMAEKYGCEMVDLRETWKKHVRKNEKPVEDFLTDVVHLNREGGKLMGDILVAAFQYHPDAPETWNETIKTVSLRADSDDAVPVELTGKWTRQSKGALGAAGKLRMTFTGNRVDVTTFAHDGTLGSARILVDGKAPSAHPKTYAATLPTKSPIDYRPAIKHVELGDNAIVESWTLTAHDVSEDGKAFAFDVKGSVTGPDGSGTHEKPFVSTSGRIRIHPARFSFAEAIRIRKKPMPERFDVTWDVYKIGTDQLKPKNAEEVGKIQRYTLIQGISNSEHILEIIPNGDGPVPIESITIHRPPLAVDQAKK